MSNLEDHSQMEIFDLNDSNVYPLEERDKNVLFQSGTFKVRLIQWRLEEKFHPAQWR